MKDLALWWFSLVVWCWSAEGGSNGNCDEAHRRCGYRSGCGAALSNYILFCSDVVHGAERCSEHCQHALIALTSTEEGENLMNCDCNDETCIRTKQRIEICRPQVARAAHNETISCRLSQLICVADAQCSTALTYYQRYCHAMFRGKKCTHRCLNSINILKKQAKAAKLSNCKCDGFEDYDCATVKSNMAKLCFHKIPKIEEETPTTVREDLRTNEVNVNSAHRLVNNDPLKTILFIVCFRILARWCQS